LASIRSARLRSASIRSRLPPGAELLQKLRD
jgi:hypothetical protein